MAGSRAPMRAVAVALALARWGLRRTRVASPRRILVLHHLLLGDTLMVTGLLSKLRTQHPQAAITMTVPRAYAPLYAGRPYGVLAHAFDPRDIATLWPLLRAPRFDLVLLPADNRWSWLARALGGRWIVALANDRPAHKNWPVDEAIPYSESPTAFVETAMALHPGPAPRPYRTADWPAPPAPATHDAPPVGGDYAVLHVGASSKLKQWEPARWRALADWLKARGMAIVWSCGPGEEPLVDAVSPEPDEHACAGTWPLAGIWHLLARARLLVAPDTGIAHLGRIVGVPTVALFGPGSALICGPGDFFAAMPYRAVAIDPFPCRDQTIQFFRAVPWARRCERLFGAPPDRCERARCMEAIDVTAVIEAITALGVTAFGVTPPQDARAASAAVASPLDCKR